MTTWLDRVRRRLTPDVLVRVAADVMVVNVALLAALFGRVAAFAAIGRQDADRADVFTRMFTESLAAYANWAGLVTAVCLVAFVASGFYTWGRAYRSRYKLLIVARAVSVAYLVIGACNMFLPIAADLSRTVILGSWIISGLLLMTARVWAEIFRRSVRSEAALPAAGPPRAVLVIGGAGYIGSWLVRRLLDRRYRVVVLDALVYGDASLTAVRDHPRLEVVPGDARDIATVVSAMQGVDAVVHLGALVGDPACAVDEKLTISINVAATRMVAEVARGAGVRRFVFASTCSVYGQNAEILDEKSDLSPVSLYARSKIASEEALLGLNDAEFGVTVLRFATLFGLSPRPRFDLVVNVMTAMAVRERRIVVMGGDQWRPFLHVADAAEAIVHTLEAVPDVVAGEILNVGSDAENYRLDDVAHLVAGVVPGIEIERRADAGDRRNYRVSFRKFHAGVGFVPRRGVRDGIAEMAEALATGAIEDFRDPRYSNHRTITDETILTSLRREDSWEQLLPRAAPVGAPSRPRASPA